MSPNKKKEIEEREVNNYFEIILDFYQKLK